jgi:hypothetical protein
MSVHRHLPVHAVLAAGWLAYGLFWAAISLRRPNLSPWRAVVFNLWFFTPCLVASLIVPTLARWLRVVPGRVASGILVHASLAAAFALAQAASYWHLGFLRPPIEVFGPVTLRYFLRDVFLYLLVASIVYARDFADAWRAQQVRAAATRAALARSALDAARWRMQPEVVMPALQRIEEHLATDADRAEEALARLGDLLRLLLSAPHEDHATLRHEIAVVSAAADLVGHDADVRLEVAPDALDVQMPRLLLLALLHRTLGGQNATVSLRARLIPTGLDLVVDAQPRPDPEDLEAAHARLESDARGPAADGGPSIVLSLAAA